MSNAAACSAISSTLNVLMCRSTSSTTTSPPGGMWNIVMSLSVCPVYYRFVSDGDAISSPAHTSRFCPELGFLAVCPQLIWYLSMCVCVLQPSTELQVGLIVDLSQFNSAALMAGESSCLLPTQLHCHCSFAGWMNNSTRELSLMQDRRPTDRFPTETITLP